MPPIENNELVFDIYVSVYIIFSTHPDEHDNLLQRNLSRLRSLYSCFDVDLMDNKISLYDNFKQNIRFPDLKYYELIALLPFNQIEYQALQIVERSFADIINYWNCAHSGRTMEWARVEINTYRAGERP